MNRRVMLSLAAFLILAAGAALAAATQLDVRVTDSLTIQGSAPSAAWLGISLYPKGATTASQGRHMVRQLDAGAFKRTFGLNADLRGGTYEVALWRDKIPAAKCTVRACQWCARNGFHMDGMVLYRTGKINQ